MFFRLNRGVLLQLQDSTTPSQSGRIHPKIMPIFQIQVYPSRSNQGHTNFPSLSAIPFPARTVMPFTTTVCNASFLCNPSLDSIRVFFSGYKCVDCFLSQAQTSRVVVLDIKVPHGWTSTQKISRALRNVHKLDRTGCAF